MVSAGATIKARSRCDNGGDRAAFDQVVPIVHDELRRLAHRYMRRVLVDHARKRRYAKRGGPDLVVVSLTEAGELSAQQASDVTALHDALGQLEKIDPQQSRVVELRFFGGFTIEETAPAKAWPYREMSQGAPGS